MIFHYLEVALVFLLILSVLVAAHEYGHYLFARLFGMGVEEFSIGMGGPKPIFTYYRRTYRLNLNQSEIAFLRRQNDESELEAGESISMSADAAKMPGTSALLNLESPSEVLDFKIVDTPTGPAIEETTVFTVRPYPIGGFVRIKGMLPQEDGGEISIPGGFYSKSPFKRFIVLLAGPFFSVLAGIVVMIPLLMTVGIVKGDPAPIIGSVLEGPASKAGLKSNDKILSVDGQPISSFYQLITKVQVSAGVPLHLSVQRGTKVFETDLTPIMSDIATNVLGPDLNPTGEVTKHAMMLATPVYEYSKLGFLEATEKSFKIPLEAVDGLLSVVKHPSTAKSVVGGPGTMIKATSDAVEEGVSNVIQVAALISISVGIFNLLPIYPLDGGQMAVALAEMIRGGRRLSLKVQNTIGLVGFATVILLVFCVLSVDFGRFFPGKPEPKIVSQQAIPK